MNKVRFSWILCFSFFAGLQVAQAYEVDTHEKLSEFAHNSSSISNDPSLLLNYGIKYLDKFPNFKNEKKTIVELIKNGARFEDTLSLTRPINHFYNPLNGSGLYAWSGLIKGVPSPNWALEDKDSVEDQHYSYKDARNYFYSALTGKVSPWGAFLTPQITERDRYFGLTFQTLGQVIHHIQDMAQPQHVRNDMHLDIPVTGELPFIPNLPGENPSLYESWTNQFVVRESLPVDFLAAGYDLNVSKFTSAFNQPRKFWTTTADEGLAQFTNRNFVSAGTNFGTDMFNSPPLTISWRTDKKIEELCANAVPKCPGLEGWVTFYGNWVDDRFAGEAKPNDRTSTLSLFDADLEKINARKTFTLNRFNFEAAHGFLIPRAVAYSAGLINYFFRGRMEFKADPNNPGKYIIKNLGAEDMRGTFTLYYDAKDGKRYPVAGDVAGETWVNRSIAAKGELSNLGFTPPVEPAPISPGVYQLVFNGDMGEEKAIPGATVGAVAATKVRPPSRIAFVRNMGTYNNRAYHDIFVINPDGTNERNVTNKPGDINNYDAAWSPDGSRIAFSGNWGGYDEIYVVDVDSGELTNISNTAASDSHPTWSPDGTRIAFQSRVNSYTEIFVASADGSSIINISKTPDEHEWAPMWSPNSNSILIDSHNDGHYGLALMDAGSGAKRSLTSSPVWKKYDYTPNWSSDGKRIVLASARDVEWEIHVVNVDTGAQTRLTHDLAMDWGPVWSPDGSRIAFVKAVGGDSLYVMKADGSEQKPLSNTMDYISDIYPTWSPDGEKIVFQSTGAEIYIIDTDGSGRRFLTKGVWPIWSPGKLGEVVGAAPSSK